MKGGAELFIPKERARSRPAAPRWRAPLFGGIAVSAALGIWLFAYAPRERATSPTPPFQRLLAGEGDWDRVLWLAHPHQNLGAVDRALGSLEGYLAELTRVAGLAAPELPRFGPFAIPPSSELALAWSDDGSRLLGVARIHRVLGWIARLSGRLAANPWLAGGEVRRGARSFHVHWEGALWIVESGEAEPWPGEKVGSADAANIPSLAEARLRRAVGALPAGRLRLARGESGLEVRGGVLPSDGTVATRGGAKSATLRLDLPDLALWVARADREPVEGPGLFLLWAEQESLIPRVAVMQRGAGQTFRLPGEALFELLGKGGPEFRLGWSVRGTDSQAQRDALRIVPWLERHFPRAGAGGAWLAAAGRLAPRRAARLLERLAGDLRKFPFAQRLELDRIEAGARLLAPFADCPHLTFEIWREPDGVLALLCPDAEPSVAPSDLSPGEDGEIDELPRVR